MTTGIPATPGSDDTSTRNGQTATSGVTLWFTGLSGAGKSTITRLVAERLRGFGLPVEVLDGDEVREHLSRGLGFSREDRDTNVKRIAYVAKLLSRNGVFVLTAAISPYRQAREWAREQMTHFVEVYVRCPLDVCIQRDVKGLYKKALTGEIQQFTGVSDPYEPPPAPEILVDTDGQTPEASAQQVLAWLGDHGYLPTHAAAVDEAAAPKELAPSHEDGSDGEPATLNEVSERNGEERPGSWLGV